MSNNGQRKDVAVWFEIPASDFERATGFYETIFDAKLNRSEYQGRSMGVFPYDASDVGGCVMEEPDHASGAGTVVYLNCDGRLDEVAGRVEGAGGKLLTSRVELPGEMGAIYQIADSEGNRVGLHAVP